MSPEQHKTDILTNLGTLAQDHPAWGALFKILELQLQDEVAAVAAPNLSAEARAFNAGRLAHALDAATALSGWLAEAHARKV